MPRPTSLSARLKRKIAQRRRVAAYLKAQIPLAESEHAIGRRYAPAGVTLATIASLASRL